MHRTPGLDINFSLHSIQSHLNNIATISLFLFLTILDFSFCTNLKLTAVDQRFAFIGLETEFQLPSQRTETLSPLHVCWPLPSTSPSGSVTWASSAATENKPNTSCENLNVVIKKNQDHLHFCCNDANLPNVRSIKASILYYTLVCTLMGGVAPGAGWRRIWQPF